MFFGGPNTEHIFWWWYQSIDSWLKQGHAGDTSSLSQGPSARPAELDHRRITWNPNGSVDAEVKENLDPNPLFFPSNVGRFLGVENQNLRHQPIQGFEIGLSSLRIYEFPHFCTHSYLPAGLIHKRKFGEPNGDGSGLALILSTKSDAMTIKCSS